jgi:hypothetical protein
MIRFGSLELKSNLFLSPLAGYTNLPFRLVVREIGGLDLATTDLVNARSLALVKGTGLWLPERPHSPPDAGRPIPEAALLAGVSTGTGSLSTISNGGRLPGPFRHPPQRALGLGGSGKDEVDV